MKPTLRNALLSLAIGAGSINALHAQTPIVSTVPGPAPAITAPAKPSVAPITPGPITAPDPLPTKTEGISAADSPVYSSRFYIGGEYLLWWIRQPALSVPLVTTGSATADNPGALGDPSTQVLLGPGGLHYSALSGLRGTTGYWLDEAQKTNIEMSGFWLQDARASYSVRADANSNLIIANPLNFIFPGQAPSAGANIISYPDSYSGGISITNTTGLWGAEVNLGRTLFSYNQGNASALLRGLVGFRYLNLKDTVSITTVSTTTNSSELPLYFLGNTVNGPASVGTFDRIEATNHFYGTQFGIDGKTSYGRWDLGLTGKVALGPNQEVLNVDGTSALYQAGQPTQMTPGGLYVLNSNNGRYSSTVFDVVPEVQASLAYRLGSRTQFSVGYNFLYFNHIARTANQLSMQSDITQIPAGNIYYNPSVPAGSPGMPFTQTSLWAQGFTFGGRFDF